MKRSTALFLALGIFSTALATEAQNRQRVLLPVTPGFVPGAHGSQWSTEAVISNSGDTPLQVDGYLSATHCGILCPGAPPLPPQQSIVVDVTLKCETPGVYLFVDAARVADLAVTLRSRDLSRQLETFGTAIPVITSSGLYASEFAINDIPMEGQFRSTLRIFNVDGTPGPIAIRFYEADPTRRWPNSPNTNADRLLLQFEAQFHVPQFGGGTASCPAAFELPLDTRPELAGVPRLRVEIQPLDGRKSYWAYVSTTHNTTQHVTVIAPKQ